MSANGSSISTSVTPRSGRSEMAVRDSPSSTARSIAGSCESPSSTSWRRVTMKYRATLPGGSDCSVVNSWSAAAAPSSTGDDEAFGSAAQRRSTSETGSGRSDNSSTRRWMSLSRWTNHDAAAVGVASSGTHVRV